MSHAGVTKQHFDLFAKDHGYKKGMNLDNVYRVFNDAIERAMTKTSAAAFLDELQKIAAMGAPAWGGSMRLGRRSSNRPLIQPTRAPSIRAPRAASIGATGTLQVADFNEVAKMRNMAQVQPLPQPAKLATPPAPVSAPGSA